MREPGSFRTLAEQLLCAMLPGAERSWIEREALDLTREVEAAVTIYFYDEFGERHPFEPRLLEALLGSHERVCLGCKRFPDGRFVWTVALGIDFGMHLHEDSLPLIFETSWSRGGEFQDVLDRYPTRGLAEEGAAMWLERFEAGAYTDTSPPAGMI